MSRPKYWTELAGNVVALLKDETLRCRLAMAGNEDVKQYSWDFAKDRFAEVVSQLADR